MKRITPLLLALLAPSIALAEQPAMDLLAAFDIPFAHLEHESVSTTHDGQPSAPTMLDVVDQLGPITPQIGSTAALLSTGNVNNVTAMDDYDHPPAGATGDRATLHFRLQVPDWANAYLFQFYFLSREYPEWVGDQYDDNFEVFVDNPAWSGQVVFDAFGNPVSVNSALFAETNPANLQGTGFDQDGGTGWVTTMAPVEPGSVLDITFTVGDEADGVWDSAVLLDGFQFSSTDPGETPITAHDLPWDPVRVAFTSPKTGPAEGGYPVRLFGSNFDADSRVEINGVDVGDVTFNEADGTLRIESMPPGAAGQFDVTVRRIDGSAHTRSDAFSYTETSTGDRMPRVWSVFPDFVHPEGGTTVELRGDTLTNAADVLFVSEDGAATSALQFDPFQDGDDLVLLAVTPDLHEGWCEIILIDIYGNRIEPGYPVQVSIDAPRAGPALGDQVACSASGSPTSATLLLLLLPLVCRRR